MTKVKKRRKTKTIEGVKVVGGKDSQERVRGPSKKESGVFPGYSSVASVRGNHPDCGGGSSKNSS
mgnify:FL=1